MHPAVFLDLDNTITHDTSGLTDLSGVTLIQGSAPAIASLRGLGYRIVVVSNQEGVARGKLTEEDVHALHARVAELVNKTANGGVIDAFYYCPYHPTGSVKQYQKDHANRKPKPGMLKQAAQEMQLDLSSSWMIGDELADVQAGHAAGVRTILLRPDADRLNPVDPSQLPGVTSEAADADRPAGPDFYAVGLVQAARLIAQQPRMESHEHKRADEPTRKWDAEKIAKIQVARAKPAGSREPEATLTGARAFRPWGAPVPQEDEKPIVAMPFRKRAQRESAAGPVPGGAVASVAEDASPAAATSTIAAVATAAVAATSPAAISAPAVATVAAEPVEIPENIRQAIERKKQAQAEGVVAEAGTDKTLRLILQELRTQRAATQDFSFLTIIAVALQLVAIICLLGGLFMGNADDGLFLRWLGAGVVAQLLSISTLLYGR